MIMGEESSENDLVHNQKQEAKTAIDRFHARKFGIKAGSTSEKRNALKIAGAGRGIEKTKKQKTPVKVSIQELVEQGLQQIANIRETIKREPHREHRISVCRSGCAD